MKYKIIVYLFFFLILVLPHFESFSQSKGKEMLIDKNINKEIYTDPENALYITQLLLSKPTITEAEKSKLIFQIAKSYNVKGDLSSALIFLYQEKDFKDYLSKNELFDIEIEKIDILIDLSLNTEAKRILKSIESNNNFASNDELKTYREASVVLEKAKFFEVDENYAKGIEILKNNIAKIENKYPFLEIKYKRTLGQLYLKSKDLSLAENSFNSALSRLKLLNEENNYLKVFVLSGLAEVCFHQKKYNEAIKLLDEAYNFSVELGNVLFQEKIINELKANYLAINDIQNYKMTTAKLSELYNEIYVLEQEAANSAFNVISEEQVDVYNQKESYFYNIIYVLVGIFLILLIYFIFVWYQFYQKKSRLESICKYLEITRNNFISRIEVNDEKKVKKQRKELKNKKVVEPKKTLISKETEQQLLLKLKKFENSKKFTNKDISLAVLSGQFETNTKYLSEVINANYHINFNTYINKLRINYIVDKIKEDSNFINYKISYLAEYCGFSSHSSFATVFKSLTGLSPVTFIDLVKNEKEILQENEV